VGSEENWRAATDSLRNALQAEKIAFTIEEGGGAFYGPKVDLKVHDAIGREWQMSTIQFDFNMSERFNITYIGEDGKEHRPFMVHRALLGSLERFFGILIEHYGGAFPFWLAPEQARILPITDNEIDYAQKIAETLRQDLFRVTVDTSSGKIGAKIRNAQLEKIPYMLIVGPKEQAARTVAVRTRSEGDQGALPLARLAEKLKEEAKVINPDNGP
jgi:threonyl-tRNA synthetase